MEGGSSEEEGGFLALAKLAIFTQPSKNKIEKLEKEINDFIKGLKVVSVQAVYESSDEDWEGYRTVYVLYEET